MKLLLEIAIAFALLFFLPGSSLNSFVFITPILTLILRREMTQALWLAIFLSIIQESVPFPASLSSGSLCLPLAAVLAIYGTIFISRHISCNSIMISFLFILFLSINCTIITLFTSYNSKIPLFFIKSVGYTTALHGINVLSSHVLRFLFQFLFKR